MFGKDVYTRLHVMVNGPGIAYRLVVLSVDKRAVLGQQRGTESGNRTGHTHTMP